MTCSYEYLSDDWNAKSSILFAFMFNYVIPMGFVLFFYEKIIVAVFFTEAAFKRAQAKLNNAASLSNNHEVIKNTHYTSLLSPSKSNN